MMAIVVQPFQGCSNYYPFPWVAPKAIQIKALRAFGVPQNIGSLFLLKPNDKSLCIVHSPKDLYNNSRWCNHRNKMLFSINPKWD